MARIRTIKPEFPHSESIGRISRDARLLFIQLWTVCDDSGRTRGNSRMLASLLFPYDDDAPGLIDGWLAELEREGMVRRYQAEGDSYIDIPKWLKHQKIDKPSPSKHPEFVEDSPKPRELSCEDQGPRTKDQGPKKLAGVSESLPAGFENFWLAWPASDRKAAKGKCSDLWKRKGFEQSAAQIVAHVEAMKASQDWRKNGGEFIPAPLAYLNQARWEGASLNGHDNPTLKALREEYGKDVRPHGDGFTDGVREWTKTGERRPMV